MKIERKRYVKFTLQASGPQMTAEQVKRAIYESALGLWGEAGSSQANVQLLEFDASDSTGILSCNREALQQIFAALALKNKYSGVSIAIRPTLVSGTINTLGPKTKRGAEPRNPGPTFGKRVGLKRSPT